MGEGERIIIILLFFRHIGEHIEIQRENNTTYEQHKIQTIQHTDKAELGGRLGKRYKYTDISKNIYTNILVLI